MSLEEVYDEHVTKVYKFFYAKLLNKHQAEDLTSQTFVAFVEKSHTQDIADATKYLYGIMRHVWVEFLKDKYKHRLEYYEQMDDFAAHVEESLDDVDSVSYIERVSGYIRRLPDRQQTVAKLRFLDGMRVRDIARHLGKDVSYVKTTQNRALKSLKQMLRGEEGVTI